MTIRYISHGKTDTGGFLLEQSLCRQLGDVTEVRFRKNYRGFAAWIRLFFQAFSASRADVVITVSRLAWPVFLRNAFRKNRMVLVLHNYDRSDGKPALYYTLLDSFLRMVARSKGRFVLVVVADYWKHFFQEKFGISESDIFVFPNTFPVSALAFYRDIVKKNRFLIHMGQYSDKIDRKACRLLIHALGEKGYACYFSATEDPGNIEFPVTVFQTREAYLKQMALAKYTVILNRIDEGWNRVAHESFLVGTQVIGFPKGGFGELLELGRGYAVKSPEEAAAVVTGGEPGPIDEKALEALDISKAGMYAEKLKRRLNLK